MNAPISSLKPPFKRRDSLFTSLKKSLSIALNKTKRHRLEHIDLRNAEITLGKTASEAMLFETECADIYQKINLIQREKEEKANQMARDTDMSLSADTKRGLLKAKDALLTKLKYSELDAVYISFAHIIRERFPTEPSLTVHISQIYALEEKIARYDQMVLELSRDAGYVFRHPQLLLAIVACGILAILGVVNGVQQWWSVRQAQISANTVMKEASQRIAMSNLEIQEAMQQGELARRQFEKTEAERLLQRSQTLANQEQETSRGPRRTLVGANSERNKSTATEKLLSQHEEAATREEYAAKVFGTVSLTPRVTVDGSLGSTSFTIKGENFDDIQKAVSDKDWLGLISLVNRRRYDAFPDIQTIDSASSKLKAATFKLHIKPSYGLKPKHIIYCCHFKDDNEYRCFSWDNNTERHPTSSGFTMDCQLLGERIVLLSGPNTYEFKRNIIGKYEDVYRKRLQAIAKQKELGEIDAEAVAQQLKALRNDIYDAMVKLAVNNKI